MREVRVPEAAELIGCSNLSVQCGMRCGALPIGSVWKNDGSSCYTYLITAQKLGEFIGLSRDEVLKRVKEIRNRRSQKCLSN